MSDTFISSVHIQKLGHRIQEIRERALLSIISKLEHGFTYDNELSRTKEMFTRLCEWFTFDPCNYQDKVLNLIEHIFKSTSGRIIIEHHGSQAIAAEIRQIRSYINPQLYPVVDQILTFIQKSEIPVEVPPLQSDFPLSYRSRDADQLTSFGYTVGSTATPIEGYVNRVSSTEQQSGLHPTQSSSRKETTPRFTFKWQPLIIADRHVLESVEQSLRNPTEPSTLLHSCEFFIDVMLQDFPAEVFLQRPAILTLFYGYIKTASSTRLTNSILNCLLKLTKNLITRIYYYRDPCTFNSKHTILTQSCSGLSTPQPPQTSSERSHMPNSRTQVSLCGSEDEDAFVNTNQLTIPQFCYMTILHLFDYICCKPANLREKRTTAKLNQIGINLSLVLLDELITLLSLCLTPDAWDKKSFPIVAEMLHKLEEVLVKFAEVLDHFRLEVMSNDFKTFDRIMHLHLLYSCTNLLGNSIPLSRADILLPRPLKNALANSLLDSALARLYPNLHETILLYVEEFGGRFETDAIAKYRDIKTVCDSFSAAIKLLKHHKSLSVDAAFKLAKNVVLSMEFHKNLSLISIVVSLCANKLQSFKTIDDIHEIAEEVVLALLAHSDSEISEEMYKQCHKRIIATIGPKLNVSGIGAPGSEILFMLRSSIFIEIYLHGLTNKNKQIRIYADDIVVHILKCKILVLPEIWNRIVQELIPTLPLLMCYAGKKSTIGRNIMNMLDPDTAATLNFPNLEILKSNLCLLFIDDALARVEAVSRLCWMMGMQTDSRDLLPRLNTLNDKSLNVICQLQCVQDINKMRPAQHFYQPSALFQVLELLNSENVEPVIRRSALTQISAMIEDQLLHHTFLERNGVNTVINMMKSALTETDYKDYVDCIIPGVSILKNICLYNASARQEICNSIDVYYYILRGLFMFSSEERMRQDCSILLFILLFHNFLLGSPAKVDLSVPYLLKDKLALPFICNTHWKTSKNTLPNLSVTLLSDKWCVSCIQIHWNAEWFGGFRKMLHWDEVKYADPQFSEQLYLTNHELLALKGSSLEYGINKSLMDIQNGTSHNAVLNALSNLEMYVNLYVLSKNDLELGKNDILSFPWEQSLSRFLIAPAANEEDMLLLISVIKFLVMLVPLYTTKDEHCWIIAILKHPSHSFPNLLQVESSPEMEMKVLHQEILNLITVCMWHEQQYLDTQIPQMSELQNTSWLHIIEIIADNLKFNDTQHFYNLAYLDSLLSCLVHLTTALGWSRSKSGNIPKEPIPVLILGLCELVGAFHCGKGPSAAASLMGLSIIRYVLLVLNHLVAEMQYFGVKGWEMCFIGERAVEENILYTLSVLWLSRDVVLRAAILQLLAGLAMSPRAAIELVHEIKDMKTLNGIWETALMIVLDHEEASIVRENAASLLGNLTSHTTHSPAGNLILIANVTHINVKKGDNVMNSILSLLEEVNFFKELVTILSSLYVNTSFSFDMEDVKYNEEKTSLPFPSSSKGEYMFAYTKSIIPDFTPTTNKSNDSSHVEQVMVVTPSFLKTLTIFVHNLLLLAEDDITNALQEYGLIKLFFRSLTMPTTKINNTKDLSLYCDILQMNTVVCALLNKAVGNNQICLGAVLHTRDCFNIMISLLNPSIYHTELPQLVYLRNRLWTEVFGLIATILDTRTYKSELGRSIEVRPGEALNIVSSVLGECGHQPFMQTLCQAISSNCSIDLQQSALSSLTSLLRIECQPSYVQQPESTSPSVQNLLDSTPTPRTLCTDESRRENMENIEPGQGGDVQIVYERNTKQSELLQNIYFGKINRRIHNKKQILGGDNKHETKNNKFKFAELENAKSEPLMAGAELCRILLHLYDMSNIKSKDNKHSKKKSIIINTLTSILCVSREAKMFALQNGLLAMIIQELKELCIKLSLESVECLRRIADKKRVNPVLKELGGIIGLLTNFMLGDEQIKAAASTFGLADVVHKIWVWFCVDRSLLCDALKMLCTYTTDCYLACQSLPLTSTIAGAGPRKSPTNLSLLHEIIKIIFKEIELVSRTHDLTILQLSFHMLHNSCTAVECRSILAKSTILQCLSRLHPALTKKQKPWETIELVCLEFLLTFTGHPEGQVCIPKTPDALELVMMLTVSTKLQNRKTALLVLRNIAFCQLNRPRLLNSDEFINILQTKLTNGNREEKYIVATIMWTLVANNQRAKLLFKCAGLDVALQESLKQLILSNVDDFNSEEGKLMHHVLHILKDREKTK